MADTHRGYDRPVALRRATTTLLAAAAGLLAVAAAVCWSLSRTVVAQQPFADRAVAALQREPVRAAVSTEIADQVDAQVPDAALSPVRVREIVDRAVLTPAFESVLREGALTLNRALFHGAASGEALRVDLGRVLQPTSPRLARIVGERRATVLTLRADGVLTRSNRLADALRHARRAAADAWLRSRSWARCCSPSAGGWRSARRVRRRP